VINKRTFLGISLARRRARRWLVVIYWATVIVLISLATVYVYFHPNWLEKAWYAAFLGIAIGFLLTFLGGTRTGRPVKDFSGRATDRPALLDNTIRTLMDPANRDWKQEDGPLDEREIRLRNAAHYEAYRVVNCIVITALALFFIYGTILPRYRMLEGPIFVLLILVIYNLPQTLILWTEPDMEEDFSGS
jgi:hypothetical protein